MQSAAQPRAFGIPPPGRSLPDTTRVGPVHLQVSDLGRSVAYYEALGLGVLARDSHEAFLGVAGTTDHLIALREVSGTRPAPRWQRFGLYHFAILLPSRADLGAFIAYLMRLNEPFASANHLVSESVYLWDPDGLGIEVYADRPRDEWRTKDGELVMTTEPLDLQGVVESASTTWTQMPAGTVMGHVHLSVGDLDDAREFYHCGLGFTLVLWSYPGALFLSAGGYHHHLGTNTWVRNARPPSADEARLLEWTLVLPSSADLQAVEAHLRTRGIEAVDHVVRDPWHTNLRLAVSNGTTHRGPAATSI